jgi:predicted regulator of Ras-like GTPase activity (Roadblock/LC7/MglB family)
MFLERLRTIAGRVDGARALSLIASDGIPVDSINGDPDLDLEALAAELITQVRAISDNHREMAVGDVRHFAVTTDQMTLMVSSVSEHYYLLLVLEPEASLGRARFELRRARLLLEEDLY